MVDAIQVLRTSPGRVSTPNGTSGCRPNLLGVYIFEIVLTHLFLLVAQLHASSSVNQIMLFFRVERSFCTADETDGRGSRSPCGLSDRNKSLGLEREWLERTANNSIEQRLIADFYKAGFVSRTSRILITFDLHCPSPFGGLMIELDIFQVVFRQCHFWVSCSLVPLQLPQAR